MSTEVKDYFPLNKLDEIVYTSNHDLIQENANVDGNSPMGQMSKVSAEVTKSYAKELILSEDVRQAIDENYIHPHDLDFLITGTTTCCQIPLGKVLKDGFNTGHGHMREPKDIVSAMALASIIFQSNQNMQHGGQSYPMFEYDLAPYVNKTFEKNKKRIQSYATSYTAEEIDEIAWQETNRDVYQACEAFIHNCNSMHSRGGGQVPFVPSITVRIHLRQVVYLSRTFCWPRKQAWVMVRHQSSLFRFLK